MPQENGLSYRVSRNGSAGGWYWEVISGRQIIGRGLARTSAQARAQAFKVVASHAVRARGLRAILKRSPDYRGTLKTTTPRSSTTEI
jgi:hypothetical protein